jgi:metal-dependent amidase/aminoacylase/carboxypeptidase family protein
MTAEDFAAYSQIMPACFYRLGTGLGRPVHTPTFDIDEAALETGAGLMAWLAVKCLASIKPYFSASICLILKHTFLWPRF